MSNIHDPLKESITSLDLEHIANELAARHNAKPIYTNGEWLTCCPIHDDSTPSLALRLSDTGKLLVKCHAGCDPVQILRALREIFPELFPITTQKEKKPQWLWVWDKSISHSAKGLSLLRSYLIDVRKIPLDNHLDALSASTRINPYKDMVNILFPIKAHPKGNMTGILKIPTKDAKKEGSTGYLPGSKAKGSAWWFGEGKTLLIAEGVETGLSAWVTDPESYTLAVTGGASFMDGLSIPDDYDKVIILVDQDIDKMAGQKAALMAARKYQEQGHTVELATPTEDTWLKPDAKLDFNDLELDKIVARLGATYTLEDVPHEVAKEPRSYSLVECLSMDIPERSHLLYPWLPEPSLCMVHAARGTGKTYFALAVAFAVCTGKPFLKWHPESRGGVLYVDGELPFADLLGRLRTIGNGFGIQDPADVPLHLINPDLLPVGTSKPYITSEEGRHFISQEVNRLEDQGEIIKLIIIDNISALSSSAKSENDAESWSDIQHWSIDLRSRGYSVLFIHHSGKTGAQRGTSKREDVMDSVLALKDPGGIKGDEGLNFVVEFQKNRTFHGSETESFAATYLDGEWGYVDLEASRYEKVVSMLTNGMRPTDIANELGISKAMVSKYKSKAMEEGLL